MDKILKKRKEKQKQKQNKAKKPKAHKETLEGVG